MFTSNSQTYDSRGRIGANSLLGDYTYSSTTSYRHKQTALNTAGTANYTGHFIQQAVYNNFKQPVEIAQPGRDKYTFQYSSINQRAHMDWGRSQSGGVWSVAQYSRHYSGDGSMEITEDAATGATTFTFYIGGDAYTAPLMYREVQGAGSVAEYLYLHRDYLSSIVAITDINGVVKEKRHFDAWGKVVKLQDGSGANLTAFVYTDRGYTGHEHLQEVSLVHMNGRLYDPVLHRFLMPDNFVQDPFNTQNYNRYAYVNFNPLSWVDWAGEQAEVPNYIDLEPVVVFAIRKKSATIYIYVYDNPYSAGGDGSYFPTIEGGVGGGGGNGKALGGGGMTSLSENDFIKYTVEGTSVWAGTVQAGFDAVRKLQPTVSTWIKGAKVFGKTSNVLGVTSIAYDFATGTANSSTIADGIVMVGGAAAIFFGGVALAPWVAGASVVYGIVSISGGEAWLNKNIDISGYLNFVKPPIL